MQSRRTGGIPGGEAPAPNSNGRSPHHTEQAHPMPGANNKDGINQCFLESDSNDTFFIEMTDHFIMRYETEVFTFSLG